MASAPLTISELADVLKGHLNGMGTLEVTGEISGYKTYPSGHHYFALKDAEAKVDCVLYSFQARWLKEPLREGQKVVAKAKADFYGKSGKMSLIIDSIKPAGEGDLFQKFKELRDKLKAEGLFDEPGPARHVGLLLEDAKGYEFPVDVDDGGTRLFNARVTNLAPNLDELRAAGVTTFLVVQSDLDAAERAAFVAGGLPALAPLASRERSTSGHLFRGVA